MVLERDFPPDLRVENEIKGLLKNGHHVILACYTITENDSVFDWNDCKVFKKRIPTFIYKSSIGALKFPFYFNFWRTHINDILKNEKVDAIHIHDLPLAKIGYEAKQKHNIIFTLDLHENWPAYLEVALHRNTFLGKILSSIKQWKNYEQKMCTVANNVIVVVDEAKDRLVDLGIDEKKVSIIANYPELSDFEELDKNDKKSNTKEISLFYAGGINKHRGLQYLIQAIHLTENDDLDIKFHIYGQGSYTDTLASLVNELSLSDKVLFHGQVPYFTVLQELTNSDITVIPHEKNNHTDHTIPHKLFQYIYSGKPVLASNCKPIERIVNDIEAGAIYEWNNPEDAYKKLLDLIHNYSKFNPEYLKKEITENYNWDHELKKLNSLYK